MNILFVATSVTVTAAPTTAAATVAPTAGAPVTLNLWHSYHAGGTEEQAINQLVNAYMAANPNVTIQLVSQPDRVHPESGEWMVRPRFENGVEVVHHLDLAEHPRSLGPASGNLAHVVRRQ